MYWLFLGDLGNKTNEVAATSIVHPGEDPVPGLAVAAAGVDFTGVTRASPVAGLSGRGRLDLLKVHQVQGCIAGLVFGVCVSSQHLWQAAALVRAQRTLVRDGTVDLMLVEALSSHKRPITLVTHEVMQIGSRHSYLVGVCK